MGGLFVDDYIFSNECIKFGVPQGSILDPLFVNIYVTSIVTPNNVRIVNYADA